MYGFHLHFYSFFCFMCSFESYLFSFSFSQSHPALYCLSNLGLALSLGFAVEHSCKASWIVHRRSTLLVSGIIATILCFALPRIVFALLTKVLSNGAQNRAFPALCWKAGFFFFLFFLWTKVICTVIFSLWNLLLSLLLPTQLNDLTIFQSCIRIFSTWMSPPPVPPPLPLVLTNNLTTTLFLFAMYTRK